MTLCTACPDAEGHEPAADMPRGGAKRHGQPEGCNASRRIKHTQSNITIRNQTSCMYARKRSANAREADGTLGRSVVALAEAAKKVGHREIHVAGGGGAPRQLSCPGIRCRVAGCVLQMCKRKETASSPGLELA